jgi:hypothetical protein
VLAGVDHGPVHLAEHLRELAERVGQGMPLGHARTDLQQHAPWCPPCGSARPPPAGTRRAAGSTAPGWRAGGSAATGPPPADPRPGSPAPRDRAGASPRPGTAHGAALTSTGRRLCVRSCWRTARSESRLEHAAHELAGGVEGAIAEGGHGRFLSSQRGHAHDFLEAGVPREHPLGARRPRCWGTGGAPRAVISCSLAPSWIMARSWSHPPR